MTILPAEQAIRSVLVRSDGDGRRVDQYLALRFPRFSRSRIQRMIRVGEIWRSDGPLKPSSTVAAGEELLVNAPELAPPGPPPPLPTVLFEDERILAVSKPAGILAHPAGLTFTYGLVGIARAARPDHVVDLAHRLDRETSGVNVLTKDKEANITLSTREIVSPSFTIEIAENETGSSLRCNGNQFRMLLHKGEEEYSVLSYSNELETIPKDKCIHLPVTPEILPEMNVRIPHLGTYTEGTVLRQSNSFVEVMFYFAAKKRIESIPLSQIETP